MKTMMVIEFDCDDARSPKCIAKLVRPTAEGNDNSWSDDGDPTAEDYAREGHGEDPLEALDDLMLGELRTSLRRAFGEEASP